MLPYLYGSFQLSKEAQAPSTHCALLWLWSVSCLCCKPDLPCTRLQEQALSLSSNQAKNRL